MGSVGRPRGRTFDSILKIRFSKAMRRDMKHAAEELETSEAEITRRAIRFWLQSKEEWDKYGY